MHERDRDTLIEQSHRIKLSIIYYNERTTRDRDTVAKLWNILTELYMTNNYVYRM